MKSIKTLIAAALILCCTVAYTQIAVVSYMKADDAGTYLQVEKDWMELHKKRKAAGEILSWTVMQKQFAGANDEYNYIVVTQYENFAQMEKEMNWDSYMPEWEDSDWDKFFEKTGNSRKMVRSEVYHFEVGTETEPENPGDVLVINWMSVAPGNGGTYVNVEKDVYKPMHEASIKKGERAGWAVWRKWPGDYSSNFVTVDVFENMAQMDGGTSYADLFKEVHSGKDVTAMEKKTQASRTMVKSEIWRNVDGLQVN